MQLTGIQQLTSKRKRKQKKKLDLKLQIYLKDFARTSKASKGKGRSKTAKENTLAEIIASTEAPIGSSVIIKKFTNEELQSLQLDIKTLADYIKVSGIPFAMMEQFCHTLEDRFIVTFASPSKAEVALQSCRFKIKTTC